ncbi:thioredoxin domain-containing protein 2 [Heterocephalus glaber]|uniref:Thioredoxin domain-containing protein 2 n=1 Tax=Heterocephalus glaber TaxID=10181 RepID=A0AAX6R015_HETGA|nr:thioredoxin domain-containing protein 2 [Heterocephalus glaber]
MEMENVQAGAPGKPETKLDPQEETQESDPRENPLQVPSGNVALLLPEFLDRAQAKGKAAFLPVVSNTLHTSTEESEFPQKGSDVPKFPANITHYKKGNISGSSAKTKHSNTKSLAKITQAKQGNIPKSSEKTIQSKEDDVPTSSEGMTQPRERDVLKSSEKSSQFKPGNILKSSANTILSKHSNIPKSLAKNTQPKQGNSPKFLASTIHPKDGDISRSSEETTQPKDGDILKSSEETTQPRESDISKSSEETTQPKEDALLKLKKESVESPEKNAVKVIMGKEHFEEALREARERLVVMDFSATWCGPCRSIRPRFHFLSLKHSDVMFLEVDADDCEALVKDCEVVCLPTFHFYEKEEKVGELCGAQNAKLEAIITELK